MKNKPLLLTLVLFAFVSIAVYFFYNRQNKPTLTEQNRGESQPAELSPQIDPANFSDNIDNKYFKLPVGKKLVYQGNTAEGIERIEITITGEKKTIMGVETLVYTDKVYVDGILVEDTRDYLAQDKDGNVWYFGEDVDNYEDGVLKDHEGSWIAGEDGAEPGIWIKNSHATGDSYKQEYYKGEAEDMRDVISVGEKVDIGLGSYSDCVKMYDWTPLDSDAKEHKFYCSEVGAMVLENNLTTGESIELIESN